MTQKRVEIDGIGEVLLQRRKGTRNLRLSVRPDGTLRVGMPAWMPYKNATAFIRSQHDWIQKHRPVAAQKLLMPDMPIGKAHRLVFYESPGATRTTTRIADGQARVIHPVGLLYKDAVVQKAAERVTVRALTAQAKQLLPERLASLAREHGFTYQSVTIKRLHTRWGSCSNHRDIVLNCHLMQLPWDLIDYVLLHELNHTQIMRHGEPFWSTLAQYVPQLPDKRKQMRGHNPSLLT